MNKKFKIITLVTVMAVITSIPLNTFAYKTRNERYPQSTIAPGGMSPANTFVDKGLPAPIVEAPEPHAIEGQINIKIDGEYEYFYDKPVLTDGRVLLPFREMFELFEMKVSWDEANNRATAENSTAKIELTVDDTTAYVNGEAKILDVPAKIVGERTYIPVRFIAESLGHTVGWSNTSQTVTITTGKDGGL